MKNLGYLPFFLFLLPYSGILAQAPNIQSATPLSTNVEQYEKFEVKLGLSAAYSNPYDYDDIRISCTFTAPNGQQRAVDGFFIQEYVITNEQTGAISALGNGVFKVRFAPDQLGTWSYVLSCTNTLGTDTFGEQLFECVAPSSGNNKGFVRTDMSNYLHFDDGEQYIPVGENIGWNSGNPIVSYRNWITKMHDNGGNFFRIWQCHWGLGIEWLNNGYEGLRRYKQNNSFYLDWLFDFCTENGIYTMLCLQHHGQVASQVNPNWSESPYNTANGGMCPNTWDFFTNELARNHVKNRLRYVMARWGYARSIAFWELFNEVDWTDQFEQRQNEVAAWHLEMAAYLKQHDPYGRLVTTSYARDYYGAAVWASPDIDITQTHFYSGVPNIERVLAAGLSNYLEDFGKPTINGEFGITTSGVGLSAADPDGIHFHNGLWGSLFAGGLGSAMSWWWDSYIDPRNLYHHFDAVSKLANSLPLREGFFKPVPSTVQGTSADLSLTPTLDWGGLADTNITIDENGNLIPAGAQLSSFLYGSQWNTQYRRPPVFFVSYPVAGQFKVRTSDASGQSPKIAIWVDGQLLLQQDAQVNQTYAVNISSGMHTIKVDNTGTDWITIASYSFSGLGSAVDAYVLRAENQSRLAGWALNNRYNHDYVLNTGLPPVASGAMVSVSGFQNGSYLVKYYDCLTGALLDSEPVVVNNGALSLALPDFLWDLAFVVDDQTVASREAVEALPVNLYPNPLATEPLRIAFRLEEPSPVSVKLLDMAGRELPGLFDGELPSGEQQLELDIPAVLPSGLYWVKILAGNRAIAKPLSVVRSE